VNSSEAEGPSSAKKQVSRTNVERAAPAPVTPTRNFFVPLRTKEVDAGTAAGEGAESGPSDQQQRNPPCDMADGCLPTS
jgi:hypothetical protein